MLYKKSPRKIDQIVQSNKSVRTKNTFPTNSDISLEEDFNLSKHLVLETFLDKHKSHQKIKLAHTIYNSKSKSRNLCLENDDLVIS